MGLGISKNNPHLASTRMNMISNGEAKGTKRNTQKILLIMKQQLLEWAGSFIPPKLFVSSVGGMFVLFLRVLPTLLDGEYQLKLINENKLVKRLN